MILFCVNALESKPFLKLDSLGRWSRFILIWTQKQIFGHENIARNWITENHILVKE